MFNMFTYFHHILLISEANSCLILMFQYLFRSLWPALQESELKLPLGAILLSIWAQILVEQILTFNLSTQTSKSDKN